MNVNRSNIAMFFVFAVTMFTCQFIATSARAQSSYFTSMGCSGCHSGAVASCNGCHAHGTHASSSKSGINITGTTNATSYAPGATVTVTITGGYRSGWVRAVLYDQNQVELARSTGNDSTMGSSTTFPATLSAPAPTTPGTYTWKAAWYGNQYDAGSATFGTGWTPDPSNPEHGYEIVNTNSFTVAAPATDITVPVVGVFTLPATATSLTVPVTSFTATDNVGVTGYQINKSATAPTAGATGWSATAPTSVTAVAGSNTFYAWAKDAAGNVSLAKSASVTVTLPPAADTTVPAVGAFTLPATATSLSVPVTSFTATDNVGVTGYLITASATAPAASATGWTATAPASVTAVAGSNTFYAWAKDAAGNVSLAKSASVTVTLPPAADTTVPAVGAFTLPATATSLSVPVTSFTATDNVGVTGYLITASATAPAASATGWTATAPASVTAVAGSNSFYAWAKDAAGNVSAAKSAFVSVSVTVPLTNLTLTSSVASPQTVGTTVTLTAGAGGSGSYEYQFFVMAPGGGWTVVRPYSTTSTYSWNTSGMTAGTYQLGVWAKTAGTSPANGADISAVASYSLMPIGAATGVTLTPSIASPKTVGTNVTLTAQGAGGSGSYEYQFFVMAPGGGWTVVRPYSTTSTYSWNTSGMTAGTYQLGVWAKTAGTSPANGADISAVASYSLMPIGAATGVTLTPSIASPKTVGTNVTLTAQGAGGSGSYEYQFFVMAPGGGWTVVRPYSTTSTYSWNTSGMTAGTYQLGVWAKTAGTSPANGADISAVASYSLMPIGVATGVNLTVSTLADGSYTKTGTLNISGTASDTAGIKSVTVNGQAVTVNADGSFSTAVTLLAGANAITVIATDNAGTQKTDSRTITYDPNAPVITIAAPADNSTTTQSFITVTGTISENSTVNVTDNGGNPQSAVITGNTFSATVYLVAGVNTISISATDLAGNTATAKRTVTYTSSNSLELAVTSPSQDITTKNSRLLLKGKVVDQGHVTVKITVNGKVYTPTVDNGAFQQQLTFTTSKLYAITVTATDDAGNISKVVRNVIYRPY